MKFDLYNDDCLTIMSMMDDNSIDSIVTDPPYGLSFMGKKWDYDVPSVDIWQECLRVLKPGGHLLAFAGTRTQHRMCVNIEDAGFEIRDMLAWIYGSGFPKSLNISKGIDKKFNTHIEGKETKNSRSGSVGDDNHFNHSKKITEFNPQSDLAKQWEGWGTALKPALEPITLARKPLSEKTIVDNVLTHGTGGINIDGSRIEIDKDIDDNRLGGGSWKSTKTSNRTYIGGFKDGENTSSKLGRFPANLIHDGSEEVEKIFPDTGKSERKTMTISHGVKNINNPSSYNMMNDTMINKRQGGYGSASRYFYCAKTSKKDRGENNNHPTVKPTELMRHLVKLVTPKGGVCLDPFMGSGSTGKACKMEGFDFIGIDLESDYVDIAKSRIESVKTESKLF